MMKNIIILTLTIISIGLFNKLNTQIKSATNLERKLELASNIIVECNNETINNFYHELSSFNRIYQGQKETEEYLDIDADGLRNAMDKLKIINSGKALDIEDELKNIPRLLAKHSKSNFELIESISNNTAIKKIIKAINTNVVIKKLAIPFFDNPFQQNDFIISKEIRDFKVKENDTLRIPIKLSTLTFEGIGIYSLVDTMNFKKIDAHHGEFVINSKSYKTNHSNKHKVSLKYFIKDELRDKIYCMKGENIELEIVK